MKLDDLLSPRPEYPRIKLISEKFGITYHSTIIEAIQYHNHLVENHDTSIQHVLFEQGKYFGELTGLIDPVLFENASAGATGSGSVASVVGGINPFGVPIKRPSLFGYVVPKKRAKKRKK
jgi:hypothetical protein